METADPTCQVHDRIDDRRAATVGGRRASDLVRLRETFEARELNATAHSRREPVDVSVVVPLYNEAGLVEEFVARLSGALRPSVRDYQIVLVDDGSTDATPELLDRIARGNPSLCALCLPKNVGQQQATVSGIREATGDIVITIDADAPVDAALIDALLKPLRNDPSCDVVSGVRARRASGMFRWAGSHLVTAILNRKCGKNLKDPGSTFRAMRRRVVDGLLRNDILAQELPLFVAYAGLNIQEVSMPDIASNKRRSSYGASKLIMTLALTLLNYSSGAKALSMMLLVGGGMILTGGVMCAGLIISGVVTQSPLPTNLLLAGLVGVVFGGQFIAFAFLGYKLELLVRNLRLRGTPISIRRGVA